MTTTAFLITLLVYFVTGAFPPVIAHYLIRTRFLGGIAAAVVVGIIAAVIGGFARTLFTALPDLIVVAGVVDPVWPLLAAAIVTTLYGVVSVR